MKKPDSEKLVIFHEGEVSKKTINRYAPRVKRSANKMKGFMKQSKEKNNENT